MAGRPAPRVTLDRCGGLRELRAIESYAASDQRLFNDPSPGRCAARYLEPKGRTLGLFAVERIVLAEVAAAQAR